MEDLHFFALVSFSHDLIAQLILLERDRDVYCTKFRLIFNHSSGAIAFSIFFFIHEGNIIEQSVIGIVFLTFLCLIIQCIHICIIIVAVSLRRNRSYDQLRIIRNRVRSLQSSYHIHFIVEISILRLNSRNFFLCLNFRSAFGLGSRRQCFFTFRRHFLCLRSILGSFFLFLISFHFFLRRFYLISSICRHVC